jgi:outer membrane protein assembly factor BamB
MKKPALKKIFLLVLLLVFFALSIIDPVQAVFPWGDDWPMFGHDPAHTSYSASIVVLNPVLLWTFPNPNITSIPKYANYVVSAPAVANGYLYISGANGGGFYCLNASTGTLIWSGSGVNIDNSPAIYNGYIYAGASPHLVKALNASTGALIWEVNAVNAYGNTDTGSSPVVTDGVVYTQGTNDLYALNASNGTQIWTYPNQGGASPAVADGHVYAATGLVGSSKGYVYALNASTGNEVWRSPNGYFGSSSPTVYTGTVYVGSQDGSVYAFNASTGALLWNYTTGGSIFGSPATANNVVYIGSWDNYTYAFNASTGDVVWKSFVDWGVTSSPAIGDNVVYVLGNDRYLYAFDASTGALTWNYLTISTSDLHATKNPVHASPVVAEGKIYIGTNEGNILAFGDKSDIIAMPTPSQTQFSTPTTTPSATIPEFSNQPFSASIFASVLIAVWVAVALKKAK